MARLTFGSQERVYVPGSSGEPSALVQEIFAAEDIRITTSFVPGLNPLRPESIGAGTRVSGLFMQPSLGPAQRSGAFRHLPVSYAGMIKHLRGQPAFDTCVIQVAPPDAWGRCSLGPAAEFVPEVLRRAGRVVAAINPAVPSIANAMSIRLEDVAIRIDADTPLVRYDVGEVDPATRRIAAHVATLIPDGAALQVGLGKVPHALMQALHDRRGLRIHSGMISDGVIGLAEAGALDPDWEHVTTCVLGNRELYDWAAGRTDIHVRGVGQTHMPQVLAGIDGFVAVNSALEVDLFGQCNLELANGRAISGAGGSTDFARAGRLSAGGLSILALPATFGDGKGSRIRGVLGAQSIASLGRSDVDAIVTEEGVADLRGRSVHERAEAIIGVAAPAMRSELAEQWREIAARL